MEMNLTGKTAVVTGAGRGIGLAVAEALTAEGAQVVGAARTVTPELEKATVAAVSADLSRPEGSTTLIDTALSELGGIDILINNVGGGDADRLGLGGFLDTPDEQWHHIFDINLFSTIRTTRAALPSLLERRGSIVNISSTSARVPTSGPIGYSEAKAALTVLSKRLSEELAPRGVRVNTVTPGVVGSSLWRGADGFGAKFAAAQGITQDELLAGIADNFGISSGRISEPEEVATLISFLASDRAANIVGADYVIDGGSLKNA